MKYLIESQIESYLRPNKSIEQFIDKTKFNDYEILKWVAIERERNLYSLILHEVFNDSAEGVESIYDFSYVEPDDIHGKVIFESKELNKVLEFAELNFKANNNKYLTFGFLNEEINNITK